MAVNKVVYTPIDSFYKLMKTVEDDPMFDKKRAQKKLRSFVEGNEFTIARNGKIIVNTSRYSLVTGRLQKQLKEIIPPEQYVPIRGVREAYKGSLSDFVKKDSN